MIHGSGLTSRFISLFYAELEESGNLAYVNGGHCPPLLVTPAGETFELKTCGPVLGPLPDAQYRRGYLTLRPGELLVLFTDGVTEALSAEGEEFGDGRLVNALLQDASSTAEETSRRILAEVDRFTAGAPQRDDVTLVVGKVR